MPHNKYHWERIDPDILAGLGDVVVAKKHNLPISTVYFHRTRQLGIVSDRRKWKWGESTTSHCPCRNILMTMPRAEIIKQSIERKRKNLHMAPDKFQSWLKGAAGNQFRKGLTI
jgi:hypothetical protein